MNGFDWLSEYGRLNSQFSTQPTRPVIGITGNYDKETCTLAEGYYQSVLRAGGIPFIIPPFEQTENLGELLDRLDGIIFSGGGNQTADLTFQNAGYYNKDGLKATVTPAGVESVAIKSQQTGQYYDLQGRRINHSELQGRNSPLRKGLYIVNGKKIVVRN